MVLVTGQLTSEDSGCEHYFLRERLNMEAATVVLDPKEGMPIEQTVGAKKGANTELLDLAVKAHGGLDRWNKVKAIKVAASITGAIWFVKGKGDALKNVVLTANTRDERLTVDFPGQDKRAVFEPNRIVIETMSGTLIEARDNPESVVRGTTERNAVGRYPCGVFCRRGVVDVPQHSVSLYP